MAIAMTNSKKDSELERVRAIFVKHTEDGLDTELELFDTDAIIEEIATNYITKEESDRRVLEARMDELQHAIYNFAEKSDGKYAAYLTERKAELRELLKGDKDG